MSSQRFTDYLGVGTHADRPVSLDLAPGCLGVYGESDTGEIFAWISSAWSLIAVVGGGGGVTGPGSSTSGHLASFNGTGGDVLQDSGIASSAVLVSGGALGTPSSVTLTNGTGLPVSTGVSGLGGGVATFLGTPSSANLAAALTDETGTGAAVFANSPTLVTPVLGTPSSGDASNLTNIPVANASGVLGATHGGAGTVSGILKANGSGTVSAAASGTDYVAPSGVGLPIDYVISIVEIMSNAEMLVTPTIVSACSFPSGAAGSYGSADVAATGSTTITFKKNGVGFATFVWSAAGTSASVTIGSTTSFDGTSDKLSCEGPATADATLAKVGIRLAGIRA